MQEKFCKELSEIQSGKKSNDWGKLGKDSNSWETCNEENYDPRINRRREVTRNSESRRSARMTEADRTERNYHKKRLRQMRKEKAKRLNSEG